MIPGKLDYQSRLAWDNLWRVEGSDTWRVYPTTFNFIARIVGTKKSVLDIGCGVGVLAFYLQDEGNDVTGLDISPVAIATMAAEFNIKGVVFDMRNKPVPFSDKQFDWCIATEFLEHFEEQQADSMLSEIARIGHNAIFCVPNNVLPPSECVWHYNVFTPESLKLLLERHYKHVTIGMFIETFDFDKPVGDHKGVMLPTIIAICSQEAPK